MTNEYRVEVRVKNNKILKKIEEAGYTSVGQFCRLNNKPNWTSRIGDYVNLRDTPLNAEGQFYPHIFEMCTLLNCSPEDLFTETQLQVALETNRRTLEVNEAEMKFMMQNKQEQLPMEEQLALQRLPGKIEDLLDTLTPREQKVIKLRFGLDGNAPLTLPEIGKMFDVTGQRIRDIETKALRKLRHPSRSDIVRDYFTEINEDD